MTADPSRGYVPHIDGLRAIAVLAVIVFHLDPGWLPGGFTGVDVFSSSPVSWSARRYIGCRRCRWGSRCCASMRAASVVSHRRCWRACC